MPLPNIPTIQPVPGGGEFLQAPIYSPTQENVFERLLQLGGQRLENPQAGFAPFEERARSQFYQNTIPGLAERFTAMGGGQKSSAFQGALGQAGSDLESQLAQLRQTYGQQQEQMGLNMLGTGLTPQYNQAYYQPTNISGALGQMAGQTAAQAIPAVAQGISNFLGGARNAAGATIPSALGGAAGTAAGAGLAGAGAGAGLAGAAAPSAAGTATGAGLAGGAAAPAAAGAGTAAGAAAAPAGAAKATTLAGALNTIGAIAMPAAVATLGAFWLYGLLKKDPSQPGQFPNPFPNGTYSDQQGNRVESQGNVIKIFDKSGKMIDTTTFAGVNPPGTRQVPQGGQVYNYYGTNKPQAGPFTRL